MSSEEDNNEKQTIEEKLPQGKRFRKEKKRVFNGDLTLERLKILKCFLYGAGIANFILAIVVIILNVKGHELTNEPSLTILATSIASSITTIIGVIAGSSIND